MVDFFDSSLDLVGEVLCVCEYVFGGIFEWDDFVVFVFGGLIHAVDAEREAVFLAVEGEDVVVFEAALGEVVFEEDFVHGDGLGDVGGEGFDEVDDLEFEGVALGGEGERGFFGVQGGGRRGAGAAAVRGGVGGNFHIKNYVGRRGGIVLCNMDVDKRELETRNIKNHSALISSCLFPSPSPSCTTSSPVSTTSSTPT